MDKKSAIDSLSALAQETRLAAFRYLVTKLPDVANAGEIARRCGVPHNTMSSHLAILERAGLAESERQGREMIYRAEIGGFRALVQFLSRDCCGGRPEICTPVLLPRRSNSLREKARA
jgi:DNA-binding transcriptional ArsR family regulator